MFTATWRNDPQFDEHMFQMGWFNHQLDSIHVDMKDFFVCPEEFAEGWFRKNANAPHLDFDREKKRFFS